MWWHTGAGGLSCGADWMQISACCGNEHLAGAGRRMIVIGHGQTTTCSWQTTIRRSVSSTWPPADDHVTTSRRTAHLEPTQVRRRRHIATLARTTMRLIPCGRWRSVACRLACSTRPWVWRPRRAARGAASWAAWRAPSCASRTGRSSIRSPEPEVLS